MLRNPAHIVFSNLLLAIRVLNLFASIAVLFSFIFSPSFKEFCFIYLVCVGVCVCVCVFMRRVVLFVLLRGFLHFDDSFSRCRNRSFENWNELKSLGLRVATKVALLVK